MRTLTTATNDATQTTITRPGYLVEIVSSTILRLSSRGDQTWGGYTWVGGRISRVSKDKVSLINSDLAYSALVLGTAMADTPVRIWKFYNDNPAADDPVQFFTGVVDDVDIGPDIVTMNLVNENSRTLFSPRKFINAASGFNHLRPAGTRISWGSEVYVLERG